MGSSVEEENGCKKVRGCKPSRNKIWEVYGSMVPTELSKLIFSLCGRY